MSNWTHTLRGRLWLKGLFGIEKENIRVSPDGRLSMSPHPSVFGDKLSHPFITTDFSESQVEMVTPPLPDIPQALGFLETIQDVVQMEMGTDLLWPQSMPPVLPDDPQIPIARYNEAGKPQQEYRESLSGKYGKRNQMISGIHFNFSFDESLLKTLHEFNSEFKTYEAFREAVYLKTTRQVLRLRWIYLLMFGNSPAVDATARLRCGKSGLIMEDTIQALSIRNSCYGYRNVEAIYPDFQSVAGYRKSLEKYITSGQISSVKELYTPVRLKFDPDTHRIAYLEFRFPDINPLTKTGLTVEALTFLHLMALYGLAGKDPGPFTAAEQEKADRFQWDVAFHGLNFSLQLDSGNNHFVSAWTLTRSFIQEIQQMVQDLEIETPDIIQTLKTIFSIIDCPCRRDVHQVLTSIQKQGFISYHLERARQYAESSRSMSYNFHGLEDMELSTQLILREAVRRGVSFELLDRHSNFVRLRREGHEQLIQQATKTALDNYVGIMAMENKAVTKHLLNKHNITTPAGCLYHQAENARQDYYLYENRPIVIKPLTTNFGRGITIIKHNRDAILFQQAVDNAFKEDTRILIEHLIAGKEYRFFVMDDTIAGILHRVPANVTGDGESTIETLIHKKNKDPLRGKGYRTPLEKIQMGEAETLFLNMQNLSFQSVPAGNEVIYLRENSNISTGGDSIDVTDDIPESYKTIAVRAARALNVRITGLDMIIQDITRDATDDNYAIIELNFNPAIHIHCHPFKGKNRRLNELLLDMLGFPLSGETVQNKDL